jgi:hypothetical protein
MSSSARSVAAAACLLLVAACTSDPDVDTERSPGGSPPSPTPLSRESPTPTPTPTPTASPSASPTTAPVRFRPAVAMADVRTLAGDIGPRLATGPGFREAARLVARRFHTLGYDVRRESFRVPAGDSWGVPVRAGRSLNVIAEPPAFDDARPHRVVGAHLDTVAVAPGAEDNASGVAVVLELARLAVESETALPTVFIAFGGEEPRGPGDELHHFGSKHYVQEMSPAQRGTLRAMVSLDRVGVGQSVPVCTGGLSPPRVQEELRSAARRMGIANHGCDSTASDHWSFEKAGFPVARIGSTPYAGYHSEADLPGVVDQGQLGRVGRTTWAWLTQSAAAGE